MKHRLLPRAALAAAALAAAPLGPAQAQLRLEATPFAGYMIDFDMESTATLTGGPDAGPGELRREIDGGPVFGVRAEAGLTPGIGVYASAARGETGDRQDTFRGTGNNPALRVLGRGPQTVWMVSGGVSVQPLSPLFRLFAGPALTRWTDPETDESTSHVALHGGAAVAFPLTPRVSLQAGADAYLVRWDDDAIGEEFGAQYTPAVQAEVESEASMLPLIRAGFTVRL